MKIRSIFVLIVLGLSLSVSVAAQKFTSGYTNLGKGCKVLKGGEGQDDVSICNGMGGYKVRVYSSAASLHITAEKARPESNIALATTALDFDQTKTPIEWRMANGRPFAMIFRVPKYAEPEGDAYHGRVIGEMLVVIGLAGYEETVSGEVDAAGADANAAARKLADDAYKAAKKS